MMPADLFYTGHDCWHIDYDAPNRGHHFSEYFDVGFGAPNTFSIKITGNSHTAKLRELFDGKQNCIIG